MPREKRNGAEISAFPSRAGKSLSLAGNAACGQICPFTGHFSSGPEIPGNVKPLHARAGASCTTGSGHEIQPRRESCPGHRNPLQPCNTNPGPGNHNRPKSDPTTTPGKAPPDFPDFAPFRPGLHRQNMVLPTQKTKNAGNGLSCPSNSQDEQNHNPHPDNATAPKLSFFDKSQKSTGNDSKSISYTGLL